jgi:hypothetical protein
VGSAADLFCEGKKEVLGPGDECDRGPCPGEGMSEGLADAS